MFTDSHCHIYKEYYDDIDEIINLSIHNNVNRFINNGCDINTIKEVIDLSNKYEGMYAAIGIHPEHSNNFSKEDLNYLESHLNDNKVVAIGEIGLDYHYEGYDKEKQIELLERQLELAEKYNKKVIIHSREATQDTINILKKYKVTGVIHSFSGSLEIAKEYIKMGYILGVNGVITFKNSKIKDVYKEIPLDKIILETDSPYLTPEPFRGSQNNPSHIFDIAKFICDIKNISLLELANITNKNIEDMFNIS